MNFSHLSHQAHQAFPKLCIEPCDFSTVAQASAEACSIWNREGALPTPPWKKPKPPNTVDKNDKMSQKRCARCDNGSDLFINYFINVIYIHHIYIYIYHIHHLHLLWCFRWMSIADTTTDAQRRLYSWHRCHVWDTVRAQLCQAMHGAEDSGAAPGGAEEIPLLLQEAATLQQRLRRSTWGRWKLGLWQKYDGRVLSIMYLNICIYGI